VYALQLLWGERNEPTCGNDDAFWEGGATVFVTSSSLYSAANLLTCSSLCFFARGIVLIFLPGCDWECSSLTRSCFEQDLDDFLLGIAAGLESSTSSITFVLLRFRAFFGIDVEACDVSVLGNLSGVTRVDVFGLESFFDVVGVDRVWFLVVGAILC
jgi:hypothetical protein